MSNMAEGFERGGLVEFHRFLAIAKGHALNCAHNYMWLWMPATSRLVNLSR